MRAFARAKLGAHGNRSVGWVMMALAAMSGPFLRKRFVTDLHKLLHGNHPAQPRASAKTSCHAADRVILDRQALAPLFAAACRTGSVILAAKPIASHRAEGERRESWPGRSGCRRCPRSGFRAGDGHQPWVIQRSGTRQAAMPGNAMAEPAAAAQTTRAQEDTAARSVHPLSRHHAERRER